MNQIWFIVTLVVRHGFADDHPISQYIASLEREVDLQDISENIDITPDYCENFYLPQKIENAGTEVECKYRTDSTYDMSKDIDNVLKGKGVKKQHRSTTKNEMFKNWFLHQPMHWINRH